MTIKQAASERLDVLAARLAHTLGPEAAVQVVAGSTLNLLVAHLGREGASRYLRLLADELDQTTLPGDLPGKVQ